MYHLCFVCILYLMILKIHLQTIVQYIRNLLNIVYYLFRTIWQFQYSIRRCNIWIVSTSLTSIYIYILYWILFSITGNYVMKVINGSFYDFGGRFTFPITVIWYFYKLGFPYAFYNWFHNPCLYMRLCLVAA